LASTSSSQDTVPGAVCCEQREKKTLAAAAEAEAAASERGRTRPFLWGGWEAAALRPVLPEDDLSCTARLLEVLETCPASGCSALRRGDLPSPSLFSLTLGKPFTSCVS